MKKVFSKVLGISVISLSALFGSFAALNRTKDIEELNNSSMVARNVESSNLEAGVEDLSILIDLKEETISYDVIFADSSFEGVEVQSYFLQNELETGGINPWGPVIFDDSTSIVRDRHATNTTSFQQLINADLTGVVVADLNYQIGVGYTKGGTFYSTTKFPLKFRFYNLVLEEVLIVNDSWTTFSTNDNKTNAEITFDLTFDDSFWTPEEVVLKSYSTDLNQSIFTREGNISLVNGISTFSLELFSNYHYYDLYLEMNFSNDDGIGATWSSDIDPEIDFVSGEIEANVEWSATSIIILMIIIILIIITIIFIVFISLQLKKRKELEKQQDQAYYEDNYTN